MGLIVLCSPDESRSLGAGSMGQAPLGPLDRGARTGAAGQAVAEAIIIIVPILEMRKSRQRD